MAGINDNTADASPPSVQDLTSEIAVTPIITEEDQQTFAAVWHSS